VLKFEAGLVKSTVFLVLNNSRNYGLLRVIFENTAIFAMSGLKFVAIFLWLRFLFSNKICFTHLFLV